MEKRKVGVIGATGMVGQRFVLLLQNHPYFTLTALIAGPRSAGRTYKEAVEGRWKMSVPIPEPVRQMPVIDSARTEYIASLVDFVFCAVDMDREATRALEERFARAEVPVVSNNSAHRDTPDVPMVIPEVNPEHLEVIAAQRRRLGTRYGFIAVKPNCSIQSYVGALTPLRAFGLREVAVVTFQAVSGAGRTLAGWPEMADNVIPFIRGEEEKSEREPMRVWGEVRDGVIVPAETPRITAQCLRVPVSDGHMAAVFTRFAHKPTREEILSCWENFRGRPQQLALPSAPARFLTFFAEEDRPQTRLDRDLYGGMGVCVGRLREDPVYDYKFVGLSHNTLRGAAGGAVLIAELLLREGYL